MADKKPINVGVIGLGRAGWGMHIVEMGAVEGCFRIAAGADPIAERGQALTAKFGSRAYTRYEDLLADADVELVVVATRSDTHTDIGIAALTAGKHVLLEKPIALNLADADRLLDAAGRARGQLLLRHNGRFEPDFLHVQEVIRSGVLGEVFEIRIAWEAYDRRADWQTMRQFGGGLLNNWGPHALDHALRLLDGEVERVCAETRRLICAGDAEDYVKALVRGKSGLVVEVEMSGVVAIMGPRWRVLGTHGALESDGEQSKMRWYDPSGISTLVPSPETPAQDNAYDNPEGIPWQEKTVPSQPSVQPPKFYEAVYRTLREGEPFPITPEEGRQVVWLTEEIRKSAT